MIDEKNLQITQRHRVDGATRVAGSPALSSVFVSDGPNAHIATVDLKTGRVRQVITTNDLRDIPFNVKKHSSGLGMSDAKFSTVTPDGKYLFASGGECLYKFRASATGLKLVEVGPRIGQGQRAIEISPDSKHVVLVSGGGNYPVPDHPDVHYGHYIYSVENLQRAESTVVSGAHPSALAWDLKIGKLYMQRFQKQVVVFNADGVEEGEFQLLPDATVMQVRTHPDGGKLCVWTDRGLFWVEFDQQQ